MKYLAAILTLGFALTSWAAQRQGFKHKHVPSVVVGLKSIGDFESTNQMHIAICLPLRNQDKLDALLADLSNPTSPNYRHWLTNGEFAQRFGPTTNDYSAMEVWAKSKNLIVSMRDDSRSILSVRGSAWDVSKALGVGFKTYQHPRENRKFHAPTNEPTVDLNIPLEGIVGLDNFSTVEKCSRLQTGPTSPTSGSGPGGSYGGYDFRNVYMPGVVLTGAGQKVGILSFYLLYTSDPTSYRNYYGLPALTYSYVNIDGGPTTTDPEAILDFDMVYAMAPGCQIKLYQGNPATTVNWLNLITYIANDNACRQITCSYAIRNLTTYLDANIVATYYKFEQMQAQGQSFFTSSGDWNAYTATAGYTETFPALFTNITVVGGTRLYTIGQTWLSESVWNDGAYGTGGGNGVGYYAPPTYQSGIDMTANKGSYIKRNYPDVAMAARDIDIIYNGAHQTVTGTSCSTPLWAGLCALINQQAITAGSNSVGWLNPSIYSLGKSAAYTDCFHDITNGNNYWASSPTSFPAVTNYDLCTGWGTPNGTNLINALYTGPTVVSLVFSNGLFIQAK